MKSETLILIVCILAIVVLEVIAMLRHIDGQSLALALTIIALLAPSPFFQLKTPFLTVFKGGGEKDAEQTKE